MNNKSSQKATCPYCRSENVVKMVAPITENKKINVKLADKILR